ncbi:hypothetical protein [Candidatus Electrothrix sp.]|uniref:hypothetical protein n=1 Tax=Candidatus Electrothrix sp. TaxID=2170559 RepID=UPI0040576ABC
MPSVYSVGFAGLSVEIHYTDNNTLQFLDFLFSDLRASSNSDFSGEAILTISQNKEGEHYILTNREGTFFSGPLNVQFAASLFDQVIFHLINHRTDGVALHSAAVAYKGGTILLPGQSGSGKSTVTAWLTSDHCQCRCSYLTDELILLAADDSSTVTPFPRPCCIKPGSLAAIQEILPANRNIFLDQQGAMLPHRLLNPDFSPLAPPLALLLFPHYQADAPLQVEKISPARTSALLMTCDVNARNLPDHGFHQLVELARSIPAYTITYSNLTDCNELLPDLFAHVGLEALSEK